jgi:hypothetical protein
MIPMTGTFQRQCPIRPRFIEIRILRENALSWIMTDAGFALLKRGTHLRAFDVACGFAISVLSVAFCPSTGKCAHTRQVVADLRQHEELVYAFKFSIHRLSNSSDCLAPSDHLLNAFTFLLADCVTRPTRSSLVNC